MGSRLDRVMDWEERARKNAYQVARLARHAGTTRQHLNRYFHSRTGWSTQRWIEQLRMDDGMWLLRQGMSIKETAHELGYRHATHFSRAIRRFFGPIQFEELLGSTPPNPEMFPNGLKCSQMVCVDSCSQMEPSVRSHRAQSLAAK